MIDRESRCRLYKHDSVASIREAINEDILRFAMFSPDYRPEMTLKTRISIFLKPGMLCLFCYRVGHFLYVRKWKRLAGCVANLNLFVHKANIPPQSCIGPACFLGHGPGATFHGTAGRNLTMFSMAICCPAEDSFGAAASRGPWLGDNVTIAAHGAVIGQVTVGDNVKIAPGARLGIDCPADTLAVSARVHFTQRPIA